MDIDDIKRLAGITEVTVSPVNMRNAQEIQVIQQLLMKSANLFQQNNSIAGKDYLKKAAMQLETLHARMRNS